MKKETTFLVSVAIIILCQAKFTAQDTALLVTKNRIEAKTDLPRVDKNIELQETANEFVSIKDSISFKLNSSLYSNGINYNINNSGFVSLKIFDGKGNEVACIISRTQKAGKYFANFSTFNLSSGIYQYQLSVNDKTMPKKTIFVN